MSEPSKPHNKSLRMNDLAVIAGGGKLPNLIYAEMNKFSLRPWVFFPANIKVENPNNLNQVSFDPFDLEGLFLELKKRNIREIVFAGKITRETAKYARSRNLDNLFYNEIYPILQQTDDQILRRIGEIFESHGFNIKSVTELLPGTLASKGNLTRKVPSRQDKNDITKAIEYHNILSKSDIGQSLIVSDGLCLAIETMPGTDAMLDFAKHVRYKNCPHGVETGIFYKAPKASQDMRFDIPVIGETTIEKVKKAKLKGIALKKNAVILLKKEEIIRLANELCIFIVTV
ncbi:MAG: UDP-2,3-diacylglucosamine diphosphatase LpxI [Paracoccaceae bacterium]|nr:UDP-2,3-diacylglucosamine diphosphatase LpxI [Paracoccaceae bacterium]